MPEEWAARLVLSATAACALAIMALCAMAGYRARYVVPGAVALALAMVGATFLREWPIVPIISKADLRSPRLWSITLQGPDQAIKRTLSRPNIGDSPVVRIRVGLAHDYHGTAFLEATVAGMSLGRMHAEGTQRGLTLGTDSLELIFDAHRIADPESIEVVLRQPVLDPSLRIVVVGWARGTVHGRAEVAFGDGLRWLPGVPLAMTGEMVRGLPMVWLDGVY